MLDTVPTATVTVANLRPHLHHTTAAQCPTAPSNKATLLGAFPPTQSRQQHTGPQSLPSIAAQARATCAVHGKHRSSNALELQPDGISHISLQSRLHLHHDAPPEAEESDIPRAALAIEEGYYKRKSY